MQARLRFAVVDVGVSPNRIVDFVNLATALPELGSCCSQTNVLDLTGALAGNSDCSSCYAANVAYYSGSNNACLWSTNRYPAAGNDERILTFGMKNQIGVCLGRIPVGPATFRRDFPAGLGVTGDNGAVDFFRAQFGFGPRYFPATTFPKVLTFAAPFQPYRSIYLVNTWQANDPLVHYTVGDLKDLTQNTIQFDSTRTKVDANLGQLNARYEPWASFAARTPPAIISAHTNARPKTP